jgi:hypothetical protein
MEQRNSTLGVKERKSVNASPLQFGAKWRRKTGVVLRHVAGEHMLVPAVTREVDLDSLFLLNTTGVFVWEQLDGHRPVGELGEAVAGKFAIDPAVAVADVSGFLSSLIERNLVEPAGDHAR